MSIPCACPCDDAWDCYRVRHGCDEESDACVCSCHDDTDDSYPEEQEPSE